MFCSKCGALLPDDAVFCDSCGTPVAAKTAAQNIGTQGYPTANAVPGSQPVYANPSPAPSGGGKSKKGLIIGLSVGLGVLFIALVAVVAVLILDKLPKKTDSNATPQGTEAVELAREDKDKPEIRLITSDVSDYPEVRLYFSVTDTYSEPVILSSPTAKITEKIAGGAEIEREIRSIERLENNLGVGFDIIIDKSGSMEADFPTMQSVLRSFISSLDYSSGDKGELIAFDSIVMYMCAFTDSPNLLLNGVSNMTTEGLTALYDALYSGITNAGSRSGANCVIAFTDGIDNESIHTYSEIVSLAQSKGIPIYIIGTSSADRSTLTGITSSTGGSYWTVDTISDISDILDEIYVAQKGMYCVTYVSDASADASAERTIACEIEDGMNLCEISGAKFSPRKVAEVKPHTSRYEIIAADISWNEANEQCIRNGGHLVTITSQSEMDRVTAIAETSGLQYIWIGGYTSIRNGAIYGHWVTGEEFSYSDWDDGEPSRYDLDGTLEAYMMLWNHADRWCWNDQRNELIGVPGLSYIRGKLGYICEYED